MMKKIDTNLGAKSKSYLLDEITLLSENKEFVLDSGDKIKNFPVAFKTFGNLNKNKSNVIVICHPLTADQYVASPDKKKDLHPVTNKPGWWDRYIGTGKAIDTNKYFVICSNIIGGCCGSLGPNTKTELMKNINGKNNSHNHQTNQVNQTKEHRQHKQKKDKYLGLNLPSISVYDMVRVQKLLLEEVFNIDKVHTVIGPSMGGIQALCWSSLYPENVKSCMIIASSHIYNIQNRAFAHVSRQAIMSDPNWKEGRYMEHKIFPEKGLSLARMNAHITYMSKRGLMEKFAAENKNDNPSNELIIESDILKSYFNYQGMRFIDRFDANSYLYLTKALESFDLENKYQKKLSDIFFNSKTKFCIVSLSDDWLFPPQDSQYLVKSLNIANCDVSYINIDTNRGHDSFLLMNQSLNATISGFINHVI